MEKWVYFLQLFSFKYFMSQDTFATNIYTCTHGNLDSICYIVVEAAFVTTGVHWVSQHSNSALTGHVIHCQHYSGKTPGEANHAPTLVPRSCF